MKQRHKGESIKIRYGSLYKVVELLVTRGWIAARETSRAGKRPERTVYALTPSGYDELRAWMQDLLRDPVREYPQFTPGLSLSPVFSTEEAVALLRQRALHLSAEAPRIETQLAELAQQEIPAVPDEPPPQLIGKKFLPLFVVEGEFSLALIKAELAFVSEFVRRITEEGWGPPELCGSCTRTARVDKRSARPGRRPPCTRTARSEWAPALQSTNATVPSPIAYS